MVLTDVLQVREEFVIKKSIGDIEALTMEDLQIREEFAKERQKTAVEHKIKKMNVFMEMRRIIGEEFQKTAGKNEIQKMKKIKKAIQRPEMIPEMLAEKFTETKLPDVTATT